MSVFGTLSVVNVNEHTEKKNGLTYLSWAWAWAEVKKNYPEAFYTIYENKDGLFYHTDGRTAWVKTGVTIEGIEHIEYLPVMDYKNKSIPVNTLTSFDVNKAIQRSLTKAVARHGLGLYIYAGEDLPDAKDDNTREEVADEVAAAKEAEEAADAPLTEKDIKALRTAFQNYRVPEDYVLRVLDVESLEGAKVSLLTAVSKELQPIAVRYLKESCEGSSVDFGKILEQFGLKENKLEPKHFQNIFDHWDSVKEKCAA